MTDDTTIALLGAGIMGSAIAGRLLDEGFSVRVWNRTREKVEQIGHGVVVAETPTEAAEAAGIVMTMLSDGSAVLDVMTKTITSMNADQIWLQTSTIGAEATEACIALASKHDIPFIDAPVSGTKEPAEKGQLLILASGDEDAIARCKRVFDAIGSSTRMLGAAGAGTRMKLVINAWLVGLMSALAETLAFARAIGVEPADFLDTLKGSAVAPPYMNLKGSMMVHGEYPPSFPLRLAVKDAELILAEARVAGIALPLVEAAAEEFRTAAEKGWADQDMAAIYEAVKPGT
jgi:3-hydroxyisobutyrate dehydrogenase